MNSTRYKEKFDTRASEWIGDMAVWHLGNELTPRQRQMVTMYYFQRKNIPVIAEELGINRSTVSRTLKRGRARIQRYLKYSF